MKKPKKKTKTKPKTKSVKAIIVLFTEEGILSVMRANKLTMEVYGKGVALADTMAMNKILTAMALGKDMVVI